MNITESIEFYMNDINNRQFNYMTYVEPNYTVSKYDKNGDPIMLTPNYEDYCVAIDLAVEVASRRSATNSKKYVFRFIENDGENSFLGGSIVDKSNKVRMLTSLPTEVFINDIRQNNDASCENIGITDIRINYDMLCPVKVDVDFVDVRGGAVLMPEELRNHKVYDSISGIADENIEGSLFKSFFTFPYPQFTLVVKGVYGQPVSYRLVPQKINTSFDDKNGSFTIKVEFISNHFSFLNDVSFNAMLAAVHSSVGGKYWEKQVENGVFTVTRISDDNVEELAPMPKLSEIIKQVKASKTALETISNDNPLTQIKVKEMDIMNKLTDILKAYKKLGEVWTSSGDCFVSTTDENVVFLPKTVVKEKSFDTKVSEIVYKCKDIDGLSKFAQQIKPNEIKLLENGEDAEGKKTYVFPDDCHVYNQTLHVDVEYYRYDFSAFCGMLDESIKVAATKNEVNDKACEIYINNEKSKLYGFVPNIENVTKILIAHMETLFHMIINTCDQVNKQQRTVGSIGFGECLTDMDVSQNQDMLIPPFPQVGLFKEGRETDAWIENAVSNRSQAYEADLVNDLLNGASSLSDVISEVVGSEESGNSELPKDATLNIFCRYPICCLDYVTSESPFGVEINYDDLNDVAARLFFRFRQVLNDVEFYTSLKSKEDSNWLYSSLGDCSGSFYEYLGVLDAYNMTEGVKVLPHGFIEKMTDVSATGSALLDLLQNSTDQAPWSSIAENISDIKYELIQGYKFNLNGMEFSKMGAEDEYNVRVYDKRENNKEQRIVWIDDYEKVINTKSAKLSNIMIDGYDFSTPNNEKNEFYHIQQLTKMQDEKAYVDTVFENDFGELITLKRKWKRVNPSGKDSVDNVYSLPKMPYESYGSNAEEKFDKEFNVEKCKPYFINGGNYDHTWYGKEVRREESIPQFKANEAPNVNFKHLSDDYTITNFSFRRKDDTLVGLIKNTGRTIVDYELSLFASQEYYQLNTIEEKALLFLHSLPFYDNYDTQGVLDGFNAVSEGVSPILHYALWLGRTIHEIFTGSNGYGYIIPFQLVPKAVKLLIGACAYFTENERWGDNPKLPPKFREYFHQYYTEDDRKYLEEEFLSWVSSDYQKIDEAYALKKKNGDLFTSEDLDWLFSEYDEWLDGKISGSKFISDLSNNLYSDFFKYYEKISRTSWVDAGLHTMSRRLILFNREDNELLDSITDMCFKPVMMVKPFRGQKLNGSGLYYWGDGEFGGKYNSVFTRYIEGYVSGINKKYSKQIEELKQTTSLGQVDNTQAPIDLKIALYKYLKLIYDRWLGSKINVDGNGEHFEYKLSELISENGRESHFFFINSLYEKVGDKVMVDMEDMVDRMIRSQNLTDYTYTFLSFYSSVLQHNRMMLFNIPNFFDMSSEQDMRDMFKPIPYIEMKRPDNMDDFVILYRSEPSTKLNIGDSEYKDDSYLITDVEENLPKALTMRNEQNGYKMPAFGVVYGGQYQSYFTDISVGMDASMATEQVIKAQMMIADMAHGQDGGENGRSLKYLGGNLYSVYSNNSYKCTVTMLGCTWVRPLMYFALLNIPLFRGTYQVIKVSHSIQSGSMVTTIVGVREPKIQTPFVGDYIVTQAMNLYMNTLGLSNGDIRHAYGDIDNNCGYKKFPVVDNYGDTLTAEWMDNTLVKDVVPIGGESMFGSDTSVLKALACVVHNEAGNQDELGKELVATTLYNRYRYYGNRFDKLLVDGQVSCGSRKGCTEDEIKIVKDVFTLTPSCLLQNDKYTTVEKSVNVFVNNEATDTMTVSKKVALEDLQKIFMYCTTDGYCVNNTNDKKNNKIDFPRLESQPSDFRKCEYILHHKGHVFLGGPMGGSTKKKWGTEVKTEERIAPKEPNVKLFECVKASCEYIDGFGASIKMDKNGEFGVITIVSGDAEKMATVFDVILNTYYSEVNRLEWVVQNENTASLSHPIEIRYIANGVDGSAKSNMFVAMTMKDNGYAVYNGVDENCSLNYKKALSKRYGSTSNDVAKSEIKNLQDDKQMEEVKKAYDNVKQCGGVMGVETLNDSLQNVANGYTFHGSDSDRNRSEPIALENPKYDPAVASRYIATHYNATSGGGKCATGVSTSMKEGGLVEIFKNSRMRPLSASRYAYYMPGYGFSLVAEGAIPTGVHVNGATPKENTYPEGYVPMDGDIMVEAGKLGGGADMMHGHIQMYNKSTNKWYSDRVYNTVFVYKDPGRPYFIFRWHELTMA